MSNPRFLTRLLASTKILERDCAEAGTDSCITEVPKDDQIATRRGEKETDLESNSFLASESDSNEDSEGTGDSVSSSDDDESTNLSISQESISERVSAIQEVQLSPDGTCILTSDSDRNFSVYTIDQDILEVQSPRNLRPYAQFRSSDPIWAFASNPYYSLNDYRTSQVLVSCRDNYISLYNTLWGVSTTSSCASENPNSGPIDIGTKLASYKLINPLTEEVVAPLSLAYTNDSTHFITGSQNQISIFDLNYTDGPVTKIRTIPSSRSNLKDGGRGYKGYISALSISPPSITSGYGILATGTRSRYVGLYDSEGNGEIITSFSLPSTPNGDETLKSSVSEIVGNGITQLRFSSCGKYLYIAERCSNALLIYDIRNFSICFSHCIGRNALSNQKLGFDIWTNDPGGNSHEIWAGGVDGNMRIWSNPHLKEGAVEADNILKVGERPVSGVAVHESGSLAITARASRGIRDGRSEDSMGMINQRDGEIRHRIKEAGCLDILGLGAYRAND